MINNSIKILLIEDNPGDARLIQEILTEANDVAFDIKWANQLSKGLEHLSSESFDVVLLDLSLPDSFGIETFFKVKKLAPKIPILILTGLDDEALGLKAVREGAQDYLIKGHLGCCNLLINALRYAIERNKVERSLQDSKRRYRMTINSMGDAIHVVDSDLRFILFNKTFKKWNKRLGLTTDVIGKTIFEVFPFLPDKVLNEYREVFETRKVLLTEEYHKIGDEEFINETRKIPVIEAGRGVRVVTVIRDITKQKKDERALKYSEEKYSNLFQHSNDEIIMFDLDGHIIDANQKALDHLGYNLSEILSLKIPELHPPEAFEKSEEVFRKIFQDGFVRFEIDFKKKNGDVFPAEVSSSLFEVEGKPIIQGIVRDITEREKAEKAIRDSEAKFRALSENSPNMIFINKRGKVVYANKRCEEIMGYKKDEFYSPDFDFLWLIAHEYHEIIKQNFNRHLKGEEVSPFEYNIITKDDKRIESMFTTKLIDYEGDKAILGIVTDITKLKEAERILKRDKETFEKLVNEKTKELLKIQKRLSDAKRLSDIGLLAATIAHELNQPLTAIMSNAQAMQRIMAGQNPDMAEIYEILSDIIKEDRRASEIIHKSRALLKQSELNLEQLNINEVIKEIIPLIHSDVLIRKISLKLDLGECIPPVRGERIQLQQVILNLLSNGMEAMNKAKSKTLTIRTELAANLTVRVSIEDSGIGVDENLIEDFFEPFYTTRKDGMGMGLAISHSIIDAHGGKLWAKNNPDHGATFFFTIPVATEIVTK